MANGYDISHYYTQIDVSANGVFEITETIDVKFNEQRRGIFRKIPYKYLIDGKTVEIKIYDIDVVGYHFSTSRKGNDVIIKIGHKDIYIEGNHTYVIKYKVKNAYLFKEDHTEFQWNLTGTDWDTNIEVAEFGVFFDQNLELTQEDYFVNAGKGGSNESKATYTFLNNKITGRADVSLSPGDGVTMYIRLPKEYITRPSDTELFMQQYGLFGIAIFIFAGISGFFYRLWAKHGKEYPIVRMVQYVPPKDLTPSEAGVIIDERADNVDVLALLPYWAHNGLINIKMIDKKWGKSDHELIKIKALEKDAPVYEHIVFDELFRTGDNVLISSLKNRFYETMNSAKVSLKASLRQKDVYYPISIKYQIGTGVVSFILVAIGFITAFVFSLFSIGIALGLSGLIGFIFTNFMLKKNQNGVRLYQETLGFKMFVEAAEKDKIERMLKEDPMYFEKTLPYAMVFGYAKKWSRKFDGLLLEPPKWYLHPGGMHAGHFSPSEFGTSFDSSMNEIKSVFNSTPEGSGGGGFSGGGSVGGGFGGGGGGSW